MTDSEKKEKKAPSKDKALKLTKVEKALIQMARGKQPVGKLVRDRKVLDYFQEILDKLRVAI